MYIQCSCTYYSHQCRELDKANHKVTCGHEALLDALGQEARLVLQMLTTFDIDQWLSLPKEKDPTLGVTERGSVVPSNSPLAAYNKFGLSTAPQYDEKRVITTTILLSLLEKAGIGENVGRLAWLVDNLLVSLPCNHHGLGEMMVEKSEEGGITGEVRPFGSALFTSLSLLNHSCLPNLARVNLDGCSVAAVATRRIAKGEELSDCYGVSCQAQPETQTRRDLLRNRYQSNSTDTCSPPKGKS